MSFLEKYISRPWLALLRAVVAGLNVGVAMTTVFSAYGGSIDPAECVLASLAAMALPIVLIVGAVLLVIDLLLWRKAALTITTGWLLSAPPVLAFAPVNLPAGKLSESEKERSFTFMTYNTLHFMDFRGEVEGLKSNATIDFILDEDADIVSMQETEMIKEWPLQHITSEQLRELAKRYPHRAVGVQDQFTVLSKYPFTCDRIQVPYEFSSVVSFYRISMHGRVVHLANCHLCSIGLEPGDKALYESLLKKPALSSKKLDREVHAVKNRLVSKLANAFVTRKAQAEYIRHCMDSIGGTWIVAGDFNDIPACYAVRTIMDGDMHDAYADCAFGPTITYHGNKFYFRIDQMLYSGELKAVGIKRPKIPSSDHYPLVGTFIITGDDDNDDE
ncbi:MAG: endonuclease/exonuclease/phosphatase family protein [Muribaculaceae bacterium]|nr:endonuclease/exonuclease/phosphatase family protein [Muribaculaceae bacterium]